MGTPETVMAARCSGCAFRPGTEANRSPFTLATARLCLIAGDPFYCHSGDAQGHDGEPLHLCRGWLDAFERQMERGAVPPWKQAVARTLLAFLESVKEDVDAGRTVDEEAFVARMLERLAAIDPDPAWSHAGEVG